MAIAPYDRHVPLIDGSITIEQGHLDVKVVGIEFAERDGRERHERMLRNGEFDAAEVSLSSYLMAREAGAPFIAIPVVPRRLFCQSLFFVESSSLLNEPADLEGKRVGIQSYQVTLAVLAKGDLEHEYGVPWKDITWVTNRREVLPFAPPPGVRIEAAPSGRTIDKMLLGGELDAVVMPHPPATLIANRSRVRRLYADAQGAEQHYFKKRGYWPVMHLIAIKSDVAARHPWLPRALFDAFERANAITRRHYLDPNYSMLAWGRHYEDAEVEYFKQEPWANGVERNRTCLEDFMKYSCEQGLLANPIAMDHLFHPATLDT